MSASRATHVNVLDEALVALDVQQLNRNTFGDVALRAEIIKLFSMQLEQSRLRIAEAQTPTDWRFVTHTLKGAAAAVGALDIARLAANWEKTGLPATPHAKAELLAAYDKAQAAFLSAAQGSWAA